MSAYVIFDAEIKKCEPYQAFMRAGTAASHAVAARCLFSPVSGEGRQS
jgi:hypothetical protein